MVYKREKALDLLPYKPFLSAPLPNDKKTLYQAINYFLVTRSSMSANNNSYKIHIYFLPSVSGQATQRTLLNRCFWFFLSTGERKGFISALKKYQEIKVKVSSLSKNFC